VKNFPKRNWICGEISISYVIPLMDIIDVESSTLTILAGLKC